MSGTVMEKIRHPLISWLMKQREPNKMLLSDFEKIQYEIRPCDVLLIDGRSRISEVIKIITQSPWSHAALYIGRLHDIENPILRERIQEFYSGPPTEQLVIESLLGRGTIVSPLRNYHQDHIRICRPTGISRQDAQQVIAYAVTRLGTEYGIRQTLDLARFLFPWSILPRRWRSSLFQHNIGTPTKEICSSMLAEAFSSVKFPILPIMKIQADNEMKLFRRNPLLYTPSDFDYSPFFEIIKYPLFQLSAESLYRNLPWSEEILFLEEEPEKKKKPRGHNETNTNPEKAHS